MRRRLPWALWLAILATYGFSGIASGSAIDDGLVAFVAYTIFTIIFATVGALVASRRPENPLGWILLGSGVAYVVGGLSSSLHEDVLDGGGPVWAAWVGTWVWMAGIGPTATFGLLLFPTGHLPSPRWRPIAWIAAVGALMVLVGLALAPGKMLDHPADNPFGLGAPWLMDAVSSVGAVLLLIGAAGAVVSLRVRYRTATSVERGQLKWLTYAGALMVVGVLASAAIEETGGSGEISNAIVTIALASVPAAIGIAILRHRLYDIDVVINRTLVYGALTATLAAAYLGTVLLFQLVLSPLTQESGLAVAASTLAVAALFRPLRGRIQGAVDRRFYRRRYDAARTLQAFSGRLRDEIELDSLSRELRSAVHETVQPAHVSLWLRS